MGIEASKEHATPLRQERQPIPEDEFRAGAASVPLGPPLGLPMVGFVRQRAFARGYGSPLEATAVVLERGELRVVVCAVDVLGLVYDEANVLIDHIVDRVGASHGLPALFDPSVEDAAGNPPALQRTRLDHPSQHKLGARG